jgi:hypothetical protein
LQDTLLENTHVKKFAILMLPALVFAAAAIAQDTGAQPGDEKINQLIIYGNDKCPQSTTDEIIVCARLDERDRYRIPKNLRGTIQRPAEAWSQRVKAYEYVAATGVGSCSASGAGGFTGCGLRGIDVAYAEKAQDPGLAFGRLIAAERNKRLAGIDAESQQVEEEVVAEERAAAAKKLQEQGNSVTTEAGSDVDGEALPMPK